MAEVSVTPDEARDEVAEDGTGVTADPAEADPAAPPPVATPPAGPETVSDADPEVAATADVQAVEENADPSAESAESENDPEPEMAEAPPSAAEPKARTGRWAALRRLRRPSRYAVLVTGLAVALIALTVAGTLLSRQVRAADELVGQRTAALDAARKVATDLTSISAENAQQRLDGLAQETTGGFRAQLNTYAAVLQAILQQSNAGSRGTVSEAGVERLDQNSASVLLAVTATVTNNKAPAAQPVSYRLVVQLQREGEKWLASDVNFVP
jgi:Mce-associated membrane protein